MFQFQKLQQKYYMKQSSNTIQQVIDVILSEGADTLYDKYLTDKLPSHAEKCTRKDIDDIIHPQFFQPNPQNSKMLRREVPKSSIESFIPNKIKINRNCQSELKPKKLLRRSVKKKLQRSNVKNQRIALSVYPIHFSTTQENTNVEGENKMRNQIKQKQFDEFQKERQTLFLQAKKRAYKKLKQKQFKQAKKKGPIIYNDEGKIINLKNYSKQEKESSQVMKLDFNTVDMGDISKFYSSQRKNVVGRKKGFYSCPKFSKKQRLNNHLFNNNNDRQMSSIPFVNLSEGTKIIERDKNVKALKTRDPPQTRQQFLKNNNHTFFRSFMPDMSEQISALTISTLDRPNTTVEFRKGQRTANTANETKNSLLWRPRTTSRGRLRVENDFLAKDLILYE